MRHASMQSAVIYDALYPYVYKAISSYLVALTLWLVTTTNHPV